MLATAILIPSTKGTLSIWLWLVLYRICTQTVRCQRRRRKITVRAQVTNTGQRAGKQVVQVYVSAPSVKLDKAYQDLCGFAKTKELASGESQEVAITFALSDFASYDETSASYILEAGNYIVRMGVSSQDTAPVALLRLQEDVTTLVAKNVLGDPGFTDLRAEAGQTENIPQISVSSL